MSQLSAAEARAVLGFNYYQRDGSLYDLALVTVYASRRAKVAGIRHQGAGWWAVQVDELEIAGWRLDRGRSVPLPYKELPINWRLCEVHQKALEKADPESEEEFMETYKAELERAGWRHDKKLVRIENGY